MNGDGLPGAERLIPVEEVLANYRARAEAAGVIYRAQLDAGIDLDDLNEAPASLVDEAAIRADERERCAQICDRLGRSEYPTDPDDCAAAIRKAGV